MTKLPDNQALLELFRDGYSDREIGEMYDVTPAAVNKRLGLMGIQRAPYRATATAIVDMAWPKGERPEEYTFLNRARELYAFVRWRLGDPKLTPKQIKAAERFASYSREQDVVLTLDLTQSNPWVWVPRLPEDGQLVLRWPGGRELPKGPHLEAITLPPVRAAE
ncbi:hypothetical protein AB0J38_41250 [Streptomyces sp. NPDC050095]|uniref:hypothetical protein n=1 Tax=unclassified Streptomyces TaxID=2593676 RepID=UPI003433C30D